MRPRASRWLGLGIVMMATAAAAGEPALPGFDFTRAEGAEGWQPTHHIGRLEAAPEGLRIQITGNDPYTAGPPRDFPAGMDLWMRVRLWSEAGGSCQVFYFAAGTSPTEEHSVRFAARPGEWTERRVPLPALGPQTRLRIDPPGTGGRAILARMTFEPRILFAAPQWPKPVPPALGPSAATVASGDLVVRDGGGPGTFEVRVAGEPMAAGLAPMLLGYRRGREVAWVRVASEARDPDGGTWRVAQRLSPGKTGGTIDVEVRVTADQPRDVVFLPMLVLAVGADSFGPQKHQGLFAGLEYLADEPSSTEADVRGPASQRQVPDGVKITLPLMVIQAAGRYVGLTWEPDPRLAAVFDSPDRLFGTGGHVMGLIFPGSDGENRPEGSLLPYDAARLEPGRPLVLKATLLGGRAESVVPAIQQYVSMRGLPPVPDPGLDWPAYARRTAAGWLDSKIREGDLYRHACWPGFDAQPAADAAVWMDVLAARAPGAVPVGRLREAARGALARVEPGATYHSGVSHVRPPAAPLLYTAAAASVETARQTARGTLRRFEPDGTVLYRRSADRPDYGSTHFARDANGLTAQVVRTVLEAAAYCGDEDLLREGLRVLAALDKFAGTVPRGAQTWEVPLHTPDILASAHLVRAYTLGYQVSGDGRFLDQARYWAWTGVPFVYLVNPTPGKVGPYSTIAVLGATGWQAPVWFGQPVQWCGLVYADALYRLSRVDPEGPWLRLAEGITAAGIQQSWTQADPDRQGLLPDFYHLRAQQPDGPAINPGTVEANALRLYRQGDVYDFAAPGAGRVLVHAPGLIEEAEEDGGRVRFRVRPALPGPYTILVSRLKRPPQAVRLDGKPAAVEAPHRYLETGNLLLHVQGDVQVDLEP